MIIAVSSTMVLEKTQPSTSSSSESDLIVDFPSNQRDTCSEVSSIFKHQRTTFLWASNKHGKHNEILHRDGLQSKMLSNVALKACSP